MYQTSVASRYPISLERWARFQLSHTLDGLDSSACFGYPAGFRSPGALASRPDKAHDHFREAQRKQEAVLRRTNSEREQRVRQRLRWEAECRRDSGRFEVETRDMLKVHEREMHEYRVHMGERKQRIRELQAELKESQEKRARRGGAEKRARDQRAADWKEVISPQIGGLCGEDLEAVSELLKAELECRILCLDARDVQ